MHFRAFLFTFLLSTFLFMLSHCSFHVYTTFPFHLIILHTPPNALVLGKFCAFDSNLLPRFKEFHKVSICFTLQAGFIWTDMREKRIWIYFGCSASFCFPSLELESKRTKEEVNSWDVVYPVSCEWSPILLFTNIISKSSFYILFSTVSAESSKYAT